MESLHHFAKARQIKEKPGTAGITGSGKLYKPRDIQAKKALKGNSRPPPEKVNEKLAIYQYLQNKGSKRSEESNVFYPSMQYTLSRNGSKSLFQDEKDLSHERKILEGSILQQRQLVEALEEVQKAKGRPTTYGQHQNNLALLLKSTTTTPHQRSSGNLTKGVHLVSSPLSVSAINKEYEERRRLKQQNSKEDLFKSLKMSMNFQETPEYREKPFVKHPPTVEKDASIKKHHRRGLSSGQNPIYIDQQAMMEQMAIEQERERQKHLQMQMLQQQQQEQQRQLQMQMQMQMLQQQQQQLQLQQQQEHQHHHQQQQQQQQQINPHQEEDEYYEEFFHMDKMTFDFEKIILAQRLSRQHSFTPTASPKNKNRASFHGRTRSIEEPSSLLPTKSSSRWTTKRSSMGEDPHHQHHKMEGARENFHLIEQTSDLDKSK